MARGAWVGWAGRAISVVLVADAVLFVSVPLTEGRWSVQASLPLALCDVALIMAAVACWWPRWLLAVELTHFWGLAGTLQTVVTPDLPAGFPQLESFMFVVGHFGIVIAAPFLVVGFRTPGRRTGPPGVAPYPARAAMASSQNPGTHLGARVPPDRRTSRVDEGHLAIQHSILIAIWHMGTTGTLYDDPGANFFTRLHPERAKNRALHQLEAMGYRVTLGRTG